MKMVLDLFLSAIHVNRTLCVMAGGAAERTVPSSFPLGVCVRLWVTCGCGDAKKCYTLCLFQPTIAIDTQVCCRIIYERLVRGSLEPRTDGSGVAAVAG
uniref:Putative secreted protein n=1 Tax=Anopheles darlingi TaxID=43151 RepID=A0A2M4DB54_ANODA